MGARTPEQTQRCSTGTHQPVLVYHEIMAKAKNKTSKNKPRVNESQVDTGGGESDAVRNQLSMGMEGHIMTAIIGGGTAYGVYKAAKGGYFKDPRYKGSAPRPSAPASSKQFSPDHPVFGNKSSSQAAMDFDSAKAAENILNKYKVGDYVPEIGGKLTARGKLNLQNTRMNYINKKK